MRWNHGPRNLYRPGFAFWPHRTGDGEVIWLEPIWVRFDCEYWSWRPWEDHPNDAIRAEWLRQQVQMAMGEGA